ncbi:MAG: glucosamine-6-phosphate deaminase [Ginsengibacter sp.]
MNLSISNNYEELSCRAANDLLNFIEGKEDPLLCMASGDSPKGLYKELITQVKETGIDISGWKFLSLDEWAGMNGHDEGSCRFHLNNDLFGPLNVAERNIIFFDGKATNAEDECKRIENFINDHRGIDVAVIGLGINGHVGMNEPGTSENSRTHVAEIASTTRAVGQKYFTSEQSLTHGLTLGIASLLDAGDIMLIVSGNKKAAAVQIMIEEEISTQLPASLLRKHKSFHVYLDSAAASQLKEK